MLNKNSRIFVAGHRGLVGSAVVRNLKSKGFENLVLKTHKELDLTRQDQVESFFKSEPVDVVVLAAAKVGGIKANSMFQVEFLYENLMMAANVIHAAAQAQVEKLLFLGSSCIYPRMAPQPIPESALLTGPLEGTNEGYALAKIAGLKLCEHYKRQYGKNFISAMPTNLYGPFDNFHPEHSHVIPGMMRRFHEAKKQNKNEIVIWGTGKPLREFLHVDDLAEALFLLLEKYDEPALINVGTGQDLTIAELAATMARVVGFEGKLVYDTTKPDGTPRKLLDVSKISALGFRPQYNLEAGLQHTYKWAVDTGAL